jgi:hypothetical protein
MCYSRARQLRGALPLPGPAAPQRRVGWERGSPPAQAGRWLQPGAAPVTTSELRPGHEMPVREARRLWLYEHLAELRRPIAEATSKDAIVDVADQALALLDVA